MIRSYDYKCLDCGNVEDYIIRRDTLQEILEATVTCPKCGSENTQRLASAPGGLVTNFADKPKTFTNKKPKVD
jgi:putative FmdB family regulatory protein